MQYRIREQKELKPSGVEWLGDIPKDWKIKKLKYLITLNPNKTNLKKEIENNIDVSFLPMDKVRRGVLDLSINKSINTVLNGYTFFKNNDILIAKVTPCFENYNCAIAESLSNNIGFGSTELNVIRCLSNIDTKFIYYFIQTDIFIQLGVSKMTGSGGLKRVPTDFFENFKLFFPSESERVKIAKFLDEKLKTFDDAISKKEELITKLQDVKQSLISEVVTGKLKVIQKEDNWKIKKLGYIFKFKNGVNADSSSYGKGLKFINVKETINTNFILEKDIEGSVSVSESIIKENLLKKGDVLFNRTSETAEEIALSTVYYDDAKALFGGFVIRGRQLTNDLDLDFKRYCFQSYEIRKQIISFASGSIRKNIAQTNLKDVYLTFPNIDTQKQISKYLDEKCELFNNTIEKTKQSIIKLKQAKEALISEAVTGKIEVL